MNKDKRITDWNNYYSFRNNNIKSNVLQKITKTTRKVTEKLILKMVAKHIKTEINIIIEAGGGDSCFYKMFRKKNSNIEYVVIDSSSVGVSIFNNKYKNDRTKALCKNLLDVDTEKYNADLVFSAGLIEHFDEEGTAKIIKSHFDLCSNSGCVLLTFPTPTLLYKILRKISEIIGVWKFYDERALKLGEVLNVCRQYGKVLDYKLNWVIGLTQYVVLIKNGNTKL